MTEFKIVSEKEFEDCLKKVDLELKFYAPDYKINLYNTGDKLMYSLTRSDFSNKEPLQAHVSKHVFAYQEVTGDKKSYVCSLWPVEIRSS